MTVVATPPGMALRIVLRVKRLPIGCLQLVRLAATCRGICFTLETRGSGPAVFRDTEQSQFPERTFDRAARARRYPVRAPGEPGLRRLGIVSTTVRMTKMTL